MLAAAFTLFVYISNGMTCVQITNSETTKSLGLLCRLQNT